MSIKRKRLLLSLTSALVVLCVGTLFVGGALTAAAPSSVGEPPADFPALEVQFASESGGQINAWWLEGESNQPAVVLAHSLRANRREMLGRARFLAAAGYSVLLFDAQAHGESPGERITFGLLESHDARAAVEFARQRNERVAYIGCSLGGAAALLGNEPLAVDALILEAVYPTLHEAAHNRIAMRTGPLANILTPLLLCQVKPRIGVSASAIAPIDSIAGVRVPLFLIAGELDQHTTLAESQRMFDAASEPKKLWVVPKVAHVNLHGAYPAEYKRRVLEFLASAGL